MMKRCILITIVVLSVALRGRVEGDMDHYRNEEDTAHVTITVVYDNNPFVSGLRTGWGFACVAEVGSTSVLFDTGGDGEILLENMRRLQMNPEAIDVVLISHVHHDHLGGLEAFLHTHPHVTVFVPSSFPRAVTKHITRAGAILVPADTVRSVARGVYTLGQMGNIVREQSMAVQTRRGLVVVTGCAHPGIVSILQRAKNTFPDEPIHLVLGGFHLGGASDDELTKIVEAFQELHIERVAPCHCTGDRAVGRFRKEYGDAFVAVGVGSRIEIKAKKEEEETQ